MMDKNKTLNNPLRTVAITILPLAFAGCKEKSSFTDDTYRNVVVIISDDHAHHTLGSYGNNFIRTPNLDRLAKQGVRFENGYCNAPICSASRQSILTGKYPQATGVTLLFTPFSQQNNVTIAEHLSNQGFATALFGKTHFNDWIWSPVYDTWPKYGFDSVMTNGVYQQWLRNKQQPPMPGGVDFYVRARATEDPAGFWNSANRPHAVYDEFSQGTFFAKEALNFMEKNKDGRFLAWIAFNEPHAPFHYPVEYAGSYGPDDVPLPEGSPEDDRWIPEIFSGLTESQKRGIIGAYYSSVEYMDKNIGLIIDGIDQLGLADNTLVIYISDNGYLLYDHKRFEKHTMWAESVQVPVIFKGKTIPKGILSDAIFEGVDVVPTICELLNVPPMKEAQGESFVPLFNGETQDIKTHAFSVFLEDNLVMIANKQWKYIFMTGKRDLGLEYATGFGAPGITHFLYDLENDPGETSNLATDPTNQEILEQMKKELLAKFTEIHPYANELPQNLNIDGKLMWFAEPRDVGAEYGGTPLRILESGD